MRRVILTILMIIVCSVTVYAQDITLNKIGERNIDRGLWVSKDGNIASEKYFCSENNFGRKYEIFVAENIINMVEDIKIVPDDIIIDFNKTDTYSLLLVVILNLY